MKRSIFFCDGVECFHSRSLFNAFLAENSDKIEKLKATHQME